ncbi:MAG: ATP-binding cassette domain-containing protein [Actinomycetaceae bacterium]|nr:ATP-binding cassette domain-containing protein [Actinomycetaceae bacterium]
MSSLIVDNVSYTYPGENNSVIRNFTYEFSEGNIYWLKGANGIGKTTLLELIGGFRSDYEGSIQWRNRKIDTADIAFLPAQDELFHELNLEEHIAVFAQLFGYDGERHQKYYETCVSYMERLNLSFTDSLVETYSKGMKEKLLFSLIMARFSSILLLDEPLTGADEKSLKEAESIIRERSIESICIIAHHNRDFMERLHSNIVDMDVLVGKK